MDKKILELVTTALKITEEDALKNSEPLPDLDATYFWNPIRGGSSVIVNSNGEKLTAGSAINLDVHKKAFLEGKRN